MPGHVGVDCIFYESSDVSGFKFCFRAQGLGFNVLCFCRAICFFTVFTFGGWGFTVADCVVEFLNSTTMRSANVAQCCQLCRWRFRFKRFGFTFPLVYCFQSSCCRCFQCSDFKLANGSPLLWHYVYVAFEVWGFIKSRCAAGLFVGHLPIFNLKP